MSTTAEILIKSRDQFSNITEKAKRDIQELGRQTKQSMSQAKDATDILKDSLGVQLPRELVKLIAHSQLLGPALSAAFSGVAVFGFITALQQIPELFGKLSAAITGWDEKSRAAYKNFLEDNEKAITRVSELKARLIEIGIGGTAGTVAGLRSKLADAEADAKQKREAASTRHGEATELSLERSLYLSPFRKNPEGLSPDELTADANRLDEVAMKAGAKVQEIRDDLKKATAQETKDTIDAHAKHLEEVAKLREAAENAWFEYNLMLRRINKERLDAQLKDEKEAGDALIKDWEEMAKIKEYREQQLLEFRNRTFAGGEDVKEGEKASDITKDKVIKNAEEIHRKTEEFIKSFREGAGKVWDDFFTKGTSVLASLANLAKGLLNVIGRTLFQDFATGLLTGSKGSSGGIAGTAGGIGASLGGRLGLGAIFGSGGSGAATAGTGSAGGLLGGGLLGGLFHGAGATTQALTSPMGVPYTLTTAGGGGLAGALGLGGGAGLLGLGAATIPVIGGVAVAAGLILNHFLGHHTQEAPFTQDPNSVQRSREFFFYAGASALADAARDLNSIGLRVSTMPAGQVVIDGMPVALNSSNQFRRDMASVLVDDV